MATQQLDERRRSPVLGQGMSCLEEKFEVIKEIGDGSFGSVVLARVRHQGASVARKGSLVAIKTMKKTFDSFAPCLELREVIFLRSLPNHIHLVPALDIFLDPLTKKLHICMEYMDGNLYQLMKARDHKLFEPVAVKSILAQIMSGLEHIHAHHFFHRDIKPENILVTSASSGETGGNLRRYSAALLTPPATPVSYAVKIADFGLARETHSRLPYTTYVSTRWYRAPEVLLRAGEYSSPVDIWAVGAMAVEIATLKPLFPGLNEVDQVWRVCEVMGSPGNWSNKHGQSVGGGEWKEGVRLAHKLGFQFPKMAPHSIESMLRAPQWPASFAQFVTWCLMWDPRARPTSSKALQHGYFADAVDPLLPKPSSRSSIKKATDFRLPKESSEHTIAPPARPSWFRRSFVGKESGIPVAVANSEASTSKALLTHPVSYYQKPAASKPGLLVEKRLTWAGIPGAAPMPILPSIRPLSPLPNTVTAHVAAASKPHEPLTEVSGNRVQLNLAATAPPAAHRQGLVNRQGSVNRPGTLHSERVARSTTTTRLLSPPSSHKENSFLSSLSHFRKRARRISGRNQLSPDAAFEEDVEAMVGCGPWTVNSGQRAGEIEATHNRRSPEHLAVTGTSSQLVQGLGQQLLIPSHKALKRQHSLNPQPHPGPVSSRTRRGNQQVSSPSVARARGSNLNASYSYQPLDFPSSNKKHASTMDLRSHNPYPTPSPPDTVSSSMNLGDTRTAQRWPTPQEEQSDWAVAALQSVYNAAGATYV